MNNPGSGPHYPRYNYSGVALAAWNFAVGCNVFTERRSYVDLPSVVHLVVLLLAAGAVRAGSVPVGVVAAVAVSAFGICRRRRAGIAESHHPASGARIARAAPRLVRTDLPLGIHQMKKPGAPTSGFFVREATTTSLQQPRFRARWEDRRPHLHFFLAFRLGKPDAPAFGRMCLSPSACSAMIR